MDDRDQLRHARSDGSAELEESFALGLQEEDPLLQNVLPEHFIFGLQELNLATKLVLLQTGQ